MVQLHPCVLDIEASGFGRTSYPIEIGYVLPDGRARCTLIRPAPHWTHWDEGAEQVHHISRETLVRHGRPVHDVARMLNSDLQGLTVYCNAWGHDYTWLSALFEEADVLQAFRLESVNRLLADASLERLALLQQQALAELGLQRHRASSDARALQLAIERVTAVVQVAATPAVQT